MRRRLLLFAISAIFGLVIALNVPARSQEPQPLQLALKAQQLYTARQLNDAADLWQQAANAFEQQGDRNGVTKSLINKSQALQDLGLYPKACKTLLQALAIKGSNLESQSQSSPQNSGRASEYRKSIQSKDKLPFVPKNSQCNLEQIDTLLANLNQKSKNLDVNRAIGLRSLGDVLRRQGMLKRSQQALKLSLLANQDVAVSSSTLLSLGNVERALGDRTRDRLSYEKVTEIIDRASPELSLQSYQEAFAAYQEAIKTASIPITKVQGQLNSLSLLLDVRKWWKQQTRRRLASWSRLNESNLTQRANDFLAQLDSQTDGRIKNLTNQIEVNLSNLSPTHQGIFAQINFAHSLMRLKSSQGIESLLSNALQQARSLKDRQGETYVLGNLGQYYAQQGKLDKAIALTRQALILAQEQNINSDSREISYLWQSQLGKLLKQQGKYEDAIGAYSSAFNTLQSLRNDLNVNDRVVQFNFLEEVRPVYLELADLLLRLQSDLGQAKSLVISNSNLNTVNSLPNLNNLELARQVIESLQLAELDNFFQDPCSEVNDVAIPIDRIDPQAAVIYPIILPERLEIILSLPGKSLKQITIPINEREVNQTVDLLYDRLYNQSVDNSASNIFNTIPLNPLEVRKNLEELLPILEQIYNWTIKPLETDLVSNQIETLVFILNGSLQKVPLAALYDGREYLLEKYNIALAPSLQLTDSQLRDRQELKVLAAGVSQQVEIRGQIFPALTNVPRELNQIEAAFPASEQLLDGEFTTETIKNRLKTDFPVIHLATHGLFSSNSDNTFIVTGDGQAISIEHLSNLINTNNPQKPELLVLSACETAIGDERAVLGLAGVTVRSGTRSTLATLWSVEDASTAKLMSQFYQEFKQPEVKKIAALRKAQLSLLQSLKLNPPVESLEKLPPHPYYWAAYVLVGNWK